MVLSRTWVVVGIRQLSITGLAGCSIWGEWHVRSLLRRSTCYRNGCGALLICRTRKNKAIHAAALKAGVCDSSTSYAQYGPHVPGPNLHAICLKGLGGESRFLVCKKVPTASLAIKKRLPTPSLGKATH